MITLDVARAYIDERHRVAAQARLARTEPSLWRRLLDRVG
jgi:hypothetical protein